MEPRLHDFRNGKSYWGHAIHGWTFRGVQPNSLLQKFQDWLEKAVRMSFMVHCSPYPQVGDLIAWDRDKGGHIVAPIIAVEPCGNPRDMFTLTAYVTPSCRKEN